MRVMIGFHARTRALLLARACVVLDKEDPARFLACLAPGMVLSTWKVRLPGMPAIISPGFVVTLFIIAELPLSQAVLICTATCAAQVLWKPGWSPSGLQFVFSVASLTIGTSLAYRVARSAMTKFIIRSTLEIPTQEA